MATLAAREKAAAKRRAAEKKKRAAEKLKRYRAAVDKESARVKQQFPPRPLDEPPVIEKVLTDGRPRVRPRDYTPELGAKVCELISTNVGSTMRLIAENEWMPTYATLCLWRREVEGYDLDFARAKRDQAMLLAEQTIDIADTPEIGERVEVSDEHGRKVTTFDMVEHRRLRCDVRKWFAARLDPERLGDRVNHAGVAGAPIGVRDETDPDSLTDAQLEAIARQLAAKNKP